MICRCGDQIQTPHQTFGSNDIFCSLSCIEKAIDDGLIPRSSDDPRFFEDKPIGMKYDTGKDHFYAMPLVMLRGLAAVFRAGEAKYETFNCLKPFDDGDRRFYDATVRHLADCQIDPLAIDEETGCLHGYQVAWNMIVRTYHAEQKAKGGKCEQG